MSIVTTTLHEIGQTLSKRKIDFVLTRFMPHLDTQSVDDLDILVHKNTFNDMVKLLQSVGYTSSSHDGALGGRIKGYQVNLQKPQRIKIDLHKDFTWRKAYYFDIDLVWSNLLVKKLGRLNYYVPTPEVDVFIIIINLIFEKTYLSKNDLNYIYQYLEKLINSKQVSSQIDKYGWKSTFSMFCKWVISIKDLSEYPVFIPSSIIFYSYLEKFVHDHKFDVISFLYFVFFRTRYLVNNRLPYEQI